MEDDDAQKLTLPPPGTSVRDDDGLWPTTADGIGDLPHYVILARQNTLCAMLDELRMNVAEVQSTLREIQDGNPAAKKAKKPRPRAERKTPSTNVDELARELQKLLAAHDYTIDQCKSLAKDSMAWEEEVDDNTLWTAGGKGRDVKKMASAWVGGIKGAWPAVGTVSRARPANGTNLFFQTAKLAKAIRKEQENMEDDTLVGDEEAQEVDGLVDDAMSVTG